MNSELVKCCKCNWVHFPLSREFAQSQVDSFNVYYDSLSAEKQQSFYGGRKSSIDQYEKCFRCGNSYKNFQPAMDKDAPMGSTIQPIIDREE